MSEVRTDAPARIEIHSEEDSVWLGQFGPEDSQAYFDLIEYDRAHLNQHGDNTGDKYRTLEDVQKRMGESQTSKLRFGIWDGETMVGSNNLTVLGDGKFESGSWVGKEHIGKNYAARARKLLLDVAFNRLGAEEVISKITVGNEPSRKSVEKSGYQFSHVDDENHWVYIFKKEWL